MLSRRKLALKHVALHIFMKFQLFLPFRKNEFVRVLGFGIPQNPFLLGVAGSSLQRIMQSENIFEAVMLDASLLKRGLQLLGKEEDLVFVALHNVSNRFGGGSQGKEVFIHILLARVLDSLRESGLENIGVQFVLTQVRSR